MWAIRNVELDCTASFASEAYRITFVNDTKSVVINRTSKDIRTFRDALANFMLQYNGSLVPELPSLSTGPSPGTSTLSQRDRVQFLAETFPTAVMQILTDVVRIAPTIVLCMPGAMQFFSPVFDVKTDVDDMCNVLSRGKASQKLSLTDFELLKVLGVGSVGRVSDHNLYVNLGLSGSQEGLTGVVCTQSTQ